LFPTTEEAHDVTLVIISVIAGLSGIALAWLLYVARPGLADSIAQGLGGLYRLVYNKYFVDEIYDATVVKPVVEGSREVLWKRVDSGLIDGSVNGVGSSARAIGAALKLLQSGNIRSYAAWVVLGSIILIITVGFMGGAR